MSAPACPRADDAASYVLRAMDDGQWEEYEAHVAGCAACTATVGELRFVSHALLNAVPQLSVSPAVRVSVMSIVRGEAELLRAAGPMADRPVQTQERRRRGLLALRPWPAAVLASAVLALGIGAGALVVGGPGETTTYPGIAAGPASAQVEQSSDGAKLVVDRMPAPPEGRIYQVWLDHGNGQAPEPTNALFSVRHGSASVDVPGDLRTVERVLVTHEPLGGSEAPTAAPVIEVRLA